MTPKNKRLLVTAVLIATIPIWILPISIIFIVSGFFCALYGCLWNEDPGFDPTWPFDLLSTWIDKEEKK